MTNFSPTGTEQNEGIANNTRRMNAAGECPDKIWVILLLAKHFLLLVKPSTGKSMVEDFCISFSIVVISIYRSIICCVTKKYCD